jgi:hypothetical protein
VRQAGKPSWRIVVRRWEQLFDCALWIRAAERLDVPADGVIPGPLELDPAPAPSASRGTRDQLAREWWGWWHSLVDAPGQDRDPAQPVPEPAYDTPDPLGLAGRPALSALVARRWPEVRDWQNERTRSGVTEHLPPPLVDVQVVQDFERAVGRPARPFDVELIVLPVRDDVVRWVFDHRYLVPERVYDGPAWPPWLRDLLRRIG